MLHHFFIIVMESSTYPGRKATLGLGRDRKRLEGTTDRDFINLPIHHKFHCSDKAREYLEDFKESLVWAAPEVWPKGYKESLLKRLRAAQIWMIEV